MNESSPSAAPAERTVNAWPRHAATLSRPSPQRSRWRFRAAAPLAWLGASLAFAAAPRPGATAPESLALGVPTVTTASKEAEQATAAPGTTIVVNQRDIQLRGYAQLTDVLRDLPGLDPVPFYFSELGTQVPVRGISGNTGIVVLLNGMRVNPPGGEAFPFRSDFSVRQAEQVEIVYGPGSTLHGPDAVSAVINVKTKAPPAGTTGEFGANFGTNRERDLWGSFSKTFGPARQLSLTGYLDYHDSSLTRLDREYPAHWADYRSVAATRTNANGTTPDREDFGLNAFVRLQFGATSLQYWHRQSRRSSAEGFYSFRGFVPEARWGDRSDVVEARTTATLSDRVKLESAVTYNRYEIDPTSRYVFPATATAWFLDDHKYGRGWSLSGEETVHAQLSARLSLVAGASASYHNVFPKASFAGGVDLDRDLLTQTAPFVFTDPAAPGVTRAIPRVFNVKYHHYAGYAELRWRVTDQLKLTAGSRVTKDDRSRDIPTMPRAALIYNVTPEWTAKLVYGRGYIAPGPYFGYATFENDTALGTTNPDLKPVTARNLEGSLTYHRKDLSLGLSVYDSRQKDLVAPGNRGLPANVVRPVVYLNGDPRQPRVLVYSANSGTSRSLGADFYGRATRGPFSPWFSYSYVDHETQVRGRSTGLPGLSRHNGRLGLTWAAASRLFLTPSLVIRSTPENVTAARLGTALHNPSFVNLHVLYSLRPDAEVFADFRNLANQRNALGGFGTLPGESAPRAIPQETFSAIAGVRLKF